MDAIGLRLARSPATVRGGAVALRELCGRAMAASGGEDESAIVCGDQERVVVGGGWQRRTEEDAAKKGDFESIRNSRAIVQSAMTSIMI